MRLDIPKNYDPKMTIRETEVALKTIKDLFEKELSNALNLTRVSAPLFVLKESGFNDDLNGVERPVSFDVPDADRKTFEIVHSLAKWKRSALQRYCFTEGEGLYTDMDAIRRDEELDNIHSIYVDQWDWEKIISKDERTTDTLEATVTLIFGAFKRVEAFVCETFTSLKSQLPEKITFITSQELEDMYPDLSAKERESAICKKHGAVFLKQIGKPLKSGEKHDGRAPDYDDWELNGDILFWFETLGIALELSSMGIRVDETSILKQLEAAKCMDRLKFEYHRNVVLKNYPYTIGGGIGQSRICMFFLQRAHIGEVQVSVWNEEMIKECEALGIKLL